MAATKYLSGSGTQFSFQSGAGVGMIKTAKVISGGAAARLDIFEGGNSVGANLASDRRISILQAPANDFREDITSIVDFKGDLLIRLQNGGEALVVIE